MSNDGYFLEASTSRCKEQGRTSEKASVNLFQEDVKSRKRKAEIEQLEGRLRVLEEEAQMLKGALVESVEDSKRLITEIHHRFNSTINRQMVQSTTLRKDRRAGLLQVLCPESNPSIVIKGLRTEALR